MRRVHFRHGLPFAQRLLDGLLALFTERTPDLRPFQTLFDQRLRRHRRRGLPDGIAQPRQPLVLDGQQGHQILTLYQTV